MKKTKLYVVKIALIMIFPALLSNCSSGEPCTKSADNPNLLSLFNTPEDEYSPFFFENKMFYTGYRKDEEQKENIYVSDIINGEIQAPIMDNSLPLKTIPNSGLPRFFKRENGVIELFFAGMNIKAKRKNSDIYYSVFDGSKWSIPVPVSNNINTDAYESYPVISKNGDFMLFVSDRHEGVGNLDLYISLRDSKGNWSEPKNLGYGINTDNSEIAPFLDEFDNLYFSSNGFRENGKYDILKSVKVSEFEWSKPKLLPPPINTDYNDMSPAVFNKDIYFSSDRKGGCGGKDIYKFNLCGNVILACNVITNSKAAQTKGTIKVLDEKKETLFNFDIDNSGWLEMSLEANKTYYLQYFNSCIPNYVPEQKFIAPCSDSSVIKMLAEFDLPNNLKQYDFSEYKVPFFVTGYYQPNTKEILDGLRLKFSYNLLGNDPSSKYIENPGKVYDEYTSTVEKALNESANYILNIIQNLNDECKFSKNTSLTIKVTGFADPRPLSDFAKFNDESINDETLNMKIEKGDKIDNLQLSKLRAYFTAKYLESYLQKNKDYLDIESKIKWQIDGKGIDETNQANELKRRVNVEIGVENK